HLQLHGAGHVGRAIVQALAPLPVRIDWIDEREDEFARHVAPIAGTADIRPVCVDAVEAEVALAPAGASYLVLTHEHDLDLRITAAILKRGDFRYLGLIGSKTKRQRFVHRFEQRGVAPTLIERITCPIGVPGITGKAPEVIAVAVAAQLLAVHGA
ncbi:MAG: xanthine dehydrogenase accessory protein XdhC, partial [Ideonella sp.]|nr:xanthine dehydrogenase accessory protein XdhC [Ideonella sp.]